MCHQKNAEFDTDFKSIEKVAKKPTKKVKIKNLDKQYSEWKYFHRFYVNNIFRDFIATFSTGLEISIKILFFLNTNTDFF